MFITEGLKSGTLSSNLLLADTGAASSYGGVTPSFWITASVAASIEIQHRDSTNSSNLWSHRFWVSAANPVVLTALPIQVILDTNERLRVMLIDGLLGAVQVTMFTS